MEQPNDNVIVSKLGKTRAGERSRIWLEGKRLSAAGFTKGTPFTVYRSTECDTWDIWAGDAMPSTLKSIKVKSGTVAGTPERPIIDTVGALVRDTFGTVGPTVRCEFHQGLIIIEAVPE